MAIAAARAPLLAFESLGESIPAESFFFAGWTSAPERGLIDRELSSFRNALAASGFFAAWIAESSSDESSGEEPDPEHRVRREEELAWWQKALARVDWWQLLHSEGALGLRVGPTGRIELLLAFDVGSPAARDENLLALRELLHGLAAVFGDYELIEAPREGVPTTILYGLSDPGEQICLGGTQRAVLVSTSAHLLRQSIELLEGRSSARPLVLSEEFQTSRAGVDSELAGGENLAEVECWFRPKDVLRDVASIAAVANWHFRLIDRESRLDWAWQSELSDTGDNLLVLACEDQESARDLLLTIPAGAHSFTVDAGARPDLWYRWFMDLVGVLSGGPVLADFVQRVQGDAKFDLEADLLRHLTGRTMSFVFEEGEPDSLAYPEAHLFEIAPPARSRDEISAHVRRLAEALEKLGLSVAPVPNAEKTDRLFRVDTVPFLGWPVIFGSGARDVVFATSVDAVERALAARDGARRADPPVVDPALGLGPLPDAGFISRVAATKGRSGCGDFCGVLRILGLAGRLLPRNGDLGIVRPLFVALPRLQEAFRAIELSGPGASRVLRDGLKYSGRGTMLIGGKSRL